MDANEIEKAWNAFKKDGMGNQTSVEDKLDVLLAQQQEIKTDTERTAEIVPEVMGDRSESEMAEDQKEEEGTDGDVEQDPYAFLDDIDAIEGEGESDGESDIEDGSEGDSDIVETSEESDGGEESDIVEDSEGDSDSDIEAEEGTEESDIVEDDSEGEDDSDEESDDESETEGDSEKDSKKDSKKESEDEMRKSLPKRPLTKSIQSVAPRGPYTVVRKSDRIPTSVTFRGKVTNGIDDLMKGFGGSDGGDPIMLGTGVNPKSVTKTDWETFYAMMEFTDGFRSQNRLHK